MKSTWKLLVVLMGLSTSCQISFASDLIPLAGTWNFALDAKNEGIAKNWFDQDLPDKVRLPGTTDENQKGHKNTNTNQTNHLSRLFLYHGPAWYQREVTIPQAWQGKRITLLLERTKRSTVWVDRQNMGEHETLAAMQVYDLTAALTPGRHRLTIRVDNGHNPPASGHQLSDDTQTNWNGIIGRIELMATDPVWLDRIDAYPSVKRRLVRIRATLGNRTGQEFTGELTLAVKSWNTARTHEVPPRNFPVKKVTHGSIVEVDYELGPEMLCWDEFNPALYRLTASLQTESAGKKYFDQREISFGMRDFQTKGTQFVINGRPTFLRGKHDACVFPLTGYPPMIVEGWLRVFRIAQSYGINHYRFHSWCPPEAAFTAADLAGIYLQPELPNFGGDLSREPGRARYTREEGHRILSAFGNHPSFVMFALGNEMGGGQEVRADIVKDFRNSDNRRLYAQASNYDLGNPKFARGDDYWTTMRTRPGAEGAVRGSFAHCDLPLGHIQVRPPSTTFDYARAIAEVPVPVIGHEVGQYQTYPDFKEIQKYTGVLCPWNFAVFRKRLEDRGMLDQAEQFFKASGALSVLCYREEIEAALRTRNFGGFQLLDLQDFPGQGTALVGILDAFMESKRLIEPRAWHEFCSATVPLAVFPRYTWTTGETFTAEVKVAHYGPRPIPAAEITWQLINVADNKELAAGKLLAHDIAQGNLQEMGSLRVSLTSCPAPGKVRLLLRVAGTEYRNGYDLWIYPAQVETGLPPGVTLCHSLDGASIKNLQAGGRVVLLQKSDSLMHGIDGFFTSDFWCYPMFRNICAHVKKPPAPGTLGILCDPAHPALARFPTEFHSTWQWWPILMKSQVLILDDLPKNYRPIVQVIDNFERNHRLGLLLEARVGKGRLLICTCDLVSLQKHPEARQLLASLLAYASSDRFNPSQELTPADLQKILAEKRNQESGARSQKPGI